MTREIFLDVMGDIDDSFIDEYSSAGKRKFPAAIRVIAAACAALVLTVGVVFIMKMNGGGSGPYYSMTAEGLDVFMELLPEGSLLDRFAEIYGEDDMRSGMSYIASTIGHPDPTPNDPFDDVGFICLTDYKLAKHIGRASLFISQHINEKSPYVPPFGMYALRDSEHAEIAINGVTVYYGMREDNASGASYPAAEFDYGGDTYFLRYDGGTVDGLLSIIGELLR